MTDAIVSPASEATEATETTEARAQESPSPRPDEIGTAPVADTEPEARLRAQYSEIAQLSGGLAHEIRNPLSTMRLNLDLLAEEFQRAETPREKRVLQKIERLLRETERLQEILEDFLRFVGVHELRRMPANLNSVVEDLRDFCEPTAAKQDVIQRAHLDPDLPKIPLDVELFKQALLNLIVNAFSAMPEGGELIYKTWRESSFVVLEVVDTGMGIQDDLQAKIFDAFFSTRPGGSGLGLPTTRKIVLAHGGKIGLESELGKGSKFTVRLPLAAETARSEEP
jgi:two-component system, NtrC family, sensor histidine kinase HydH